MIKGVTELLSREKLLVLYEASGKFLLNRSFSAVSRRDAPPRSTPIFAKAQLQEFANAE